MPTLVKCQLSVVSCIMLGPASLPRLIGILFRWLERGSGEEALYEPIHLVPKYGPREFAIERSSTDIFLLEVQVVMDSLNDAFGTLDDSKAIGT